MDRLTATKVFVSVVDQGSLTLAAQALDMSTAMVSRYLAAMESWLDARLLHRTTRRISLTEAGQSALPVCRQMLEFEGDLQELAGTARREPMGRLRVACSQSFGQAQLASALIEFQCRHPKVSISLLSAERPVDLAAERIDVALRITNRLEAGLISRRIATCHSCLCATPDYLSKNGVPAVPGDLRGHRCLSHVVVSAAQFRFADGARTIDLTGLDAFSSNDTSTLRSAVLAGGGVGILPTYLAGADIAQGRLVRVLPDLQPEPLGIHAIFLSREHQPLALRLLIDFLAERFGGPLAPWDHVD